VITDGPATLRAGQITVNESRGILNIQVDRNQVDLRREDLTVIQTQLWDIGIIISPSKSYKFGTMDLAGLTVYFSGWAEL
jgi:hypothetical protein